MIRPSSVAGGHDSAILDTLIAMHAGPSPRIVDVTHNKGKMWVGSKHRPLRCDAEPSMPVDIVADFRAIPLPDESVDVVVFDPPHLLDVGNTKKYSMYGVTQRQARSISHDFPPFLASASRVLAPHGIILAKLADMVHDHRYQWAQVDFVVAARDAGLTPCDMVVKIATGVQTMIDPKWKAVHHTRRAHSYWIVVRKGRCER